MPRPFKGSRHGLDEGLTAELVEYCEANDKLPTRVIRTAVRQFLDNEKSRARFDKSGEAPLQRK